MHAGLLRPDSAPAPALGEAAEVARELAALGEEAGCAPGEVALVFDYESAWAWETQPQGRDFSYFRLVFDFYRGLGRLGLNVDIVPPDSADLSAYKLVLAPGLATLGPALDGALAAHDGIVLVGPRSNAKTPDFATPVPLPPQLPGLDCLVARVESLPPGVDVPLAGGGAFLRWFEEIEGGAEVLLATADGRPAMVAADGLRYLAGWPDDAAMDRLLAEAARAAGLAPEVLPEGLRRRDTAGHRIWLNYNGGPVRHDGREVPGCGVHVEPRPAAGSTR
jgi:beta-galactosidase